MKSKWNSEKMIIDGEERYIIYRLLDISEKDYKGNREEWGTAKTSEEAERKVKVLNSGDVPISQKRFDVIRGKSLREFALWLSDEDNLYKFCRKEYCPYCEGDGGCSYFKQKENENGYCVEAIINWLSEEIAVNW